MGVIRTAGQVMGLTEIKETIILLLSYGKKLLKTIKSSAPV